MRNAFWATAFFLAAISVLGGCARSVQIVKPVHQSAQTLFVDFEVKFDSRADTSTFRADLDGQDIGAQFTIAGTLATASMELSPGGHTVAATLPH